MKMALLSRPSASTLLLYALRIALTLSPGYLHPDEFFQSLEPAAARLAGLDAAIPWEYESPPVRSWLPVAVLTGLPIYLLRYWTPFTPGAMALLAASRLPYCVASFAVDFALARVCHHFSPRTRGGDLLPPLLLLHASAWPTLVFGSRTFSNGIEAALFAVAIMLALTCRGPSRAHRTSLILGSLLAAGCWVRFTFAFFWLPVAVHVAAAGPIPWLISVRAMALAAFLTAVALFSADCCFIGLSTCMAAPWKFIAPLNNLAYNLQHPNLASHGLHPRLTHALVNLPLLFGPLAFSLGADVIATFTARPPRAPANAMAPMLLRSERAMLLGAVAVPLVALSLAPHQEARFLLPLQTPLLLLYGSTARSKFPWCTFNGALAAFFAFVHQAGVVRAMAHVQARGGASPPAVVVFSHSYMPPRSLLWQTTSPLPPAITVVDLLSNGSACDVMGALREQLFTAKGRRGSLVVRVALPALLARSVIAHGASDSCSQRTATNTWWRRVSSLWSMRLAFTLERRLWPHWSSEATPMSLHDAALEVYVVETVRRGPFGSW